MVIASPDVIASAIRSAAAPIPVSDEGSGISRANHFTARGLAKVLALLAPHAELLRHSKGAAFKTGTLDGVRTLAGYADTAQHGKVRFVISLTGNTGALRFRLMQAIQAAL